MERYYDVELRLRNLLSRQVDLSGNGFMHIKENWLEGCISEIYFRGFITQELVMIDFFMTKFEENSYNGDILFIPRFETICISKSDFILPGRFFLKNKVSEIQFYVIRQEKFSLKQKIIDKEIISAKEFSKLYAGLNDEMK